MGITKTSFRICNPKDEEKCTVVEDAIVDTGSVLTWVPSTILEGIGLKPEETRMFSTITGLKVKRGVAPALCEIGDSKAGCNVVFGEDGDGIVLGVTALETLGLEVSPETGKLYKKESYLAL